MHDNDTSLLRTFLTLADSRSFSRTGDRIGRSQSAVSGQIRRETLVWVAAPGFTLDVDRPVPLFASPAPCVYRRRATQALEGAGRLWTGIFTSPSFSGCLAAVRAGLGVAVMPRAMVPPGLDVLTGWPDLAPAELAMLGRDRPTPAAAALGAFIAARVHRQG